MLVPNAEIESGPVQPIAVRQKTEAGSVDAVRPSCCVERCQEDLARAEAAHRMMQAADICLRSGDDHALQALGFSMAHIADLRGRSAGATSGYPAYALRNARQTVRWLRARLLSLQSRGSISG